MKKLLPYLALFLFTACAPNVGQRMDQIEPGMTKAAVLQILGHPIAVSGADGVEVLHYTVKEAYYRERYVYIRLKNGRVDSYGSETRRNPRQN